MSGVGELRKCLQRAGDPAWNDVVDSLIIAVCEDERKRCQELAKDANCETMFIRGCPLFNNAPTTIMDAKTGKIAGGTPC